MVGQIRFAYVPDVGSFNMSTTTTTTELPTTSLQFSSTMLSVSNQNYTPIEVVVALTFAVGLIQVRVFTYPSQCYLIMF
jgi:hypothetical protein